MIFLNFCLVVQYISARSILDVHKLVNIKKVDTIQEYQLPVAGEKMTSPIGVCLEINGRERVEMRDMEIEKYYWLFIPD